MDSNSRLLESKGHFPTSTRHLPGKKDQARTGRWTKKKAGGRRCRPFPVTSQREEVLAGHPAEQREEVPLTGYSLMAAIIHLIVFKKMRPFVASSDHAQMLGNLDFLHRLLEGGLDRLGDVLGRLGGNGLEVLGLLDGRFDALAQEGGLQLDDFRQRLGAD